MTTKLENSSMPVIAASYLGPALIPNADAAWDEAKLPANADDLVQKIMGQPMRRAGRFIKLVCCGALSCMQGAPKEVLQGKRTGIFLSTGLGNIDEILPFITQVFKHDGGFPSPNQFANSVSNAAAFFLAKACDVKGTVITVSQEELSFESALWLAQSYLDAGEIELALVGGCDVFTPAVEDYRERLNLVPGRYRRAPLGEGSSWFLLGGDGKTKIGDILSVEISSGLADTENLSSDDLLENCEKLFEEFQHNMKPSDNGSKLLLPGFRLFSIDEASWKKNGWDIDDYLPHCGISSTASAYGLARGMMSHRRSFLVHGNDHASGRRALIAAVTK
ncbi:MAG: beta-ketoacyl synthase N-terminal-like domain-containing protein [Smithellaceae bacterium]